MKSKSESKAVEIAEQEARERIANFFLSCIPTAKPPIVDWCEQNVIFPSSARSSRFNISITPWNREPMERWADLVTRSITYMKPIQSGGSAAGECALLYAIKFMRGICQYNWSNDKRAGERWNSRVRGIFLACKPVAELMEAAKVSGLDIDFGNLFFRMQGVFTDSNLDSDTIPLQINEELHDWVAGHLKKAEGRATAVWNYKRLNISNAGMKGDQLDQAFRSGTMQPWQVKCLGCGQFHVMRTRWEDDKPTLGGLRYDAAKARRGRHDYDYNILRPTIRFQMPCGFTFHNEDLMIRRKLSTGGEYGEPTNKGAELAHRSYTLEAVSVDYIDLMTLIKEKHEALKARAYGDPQPWRRYKSERECIPYDPDDVPITVGAVILTPELKKSREGLPMPRFRPFALDRQHGEEAKGEKPYWWLLIRDYKIFFGVMTSRLVFEGRCDSDEDVIRVLIEHQVEFHHGCADSGHDTDHVYQFCMKYGINAIKGAGNPWFQHEDKSKRIYSTERPVHTMLGSAAKYPYVERLDKGVLVSEPDPREPLFWQYSKGGIREKLSWLRGSIDFQTPSDVSDAYKLHMEAEIRNERVHPRTGETIIEWIQQKSRNDLFVCECYIAMMVQMSGAVGESNIYEVQTTNVTK